MKQIIKNIVFDVGNVLLEWNPFAITQRAFPDHQDPQMFSQQLFRSEIWMDLNRGFFSEAEAIEKYQAEFNLSKAQSECLLATVKSSLLPVPGGIELLKTFHQAGLGVYALTDNVHELVQHIKQQYDFWPLFHGAVVSAEVGVLKPDAKIYQHLLDTYQLNAEETVFLDDMAHNVAGAKKLNIHAIQFENIQQCINELRALGLLV